MFAKARAIAGGTALVVANSRSGEDTRTVAVDLDGKEHTARSAGGMSATFGSGSLQLHNLEFNLPVYQIREFRFQTRPYQFAEFRDVPLDPRPSPANP
jgi:hypothetical protein